MTDLELLTPNEIIKSKRKSISLTIKNNGDFIVRAPLKSREEEIFKFMKEKSSWIIKKRTEQLSNLFRPLSFSSAEQIMILGRIYNILYTNSNSVNLTSNEILLPNQNSKEKLITFLKNFSKKYITERVQLISNLFNFNYLSISITSAKTCWGSCSFSNRLHFTYKLIMCPEDVIDYIITHELCHTKIKNHSAKFWVLVENCYPNYKVHEKWLKKNRAIIELI